MSNRPFTVGILGASHIAPMAMIDPARRCGVSVGAIASRRPGAAVTYAAAHGIPRAYETYEALFTDPEINLVYNSLPPSEHARWSIAALRAGKDVLCEKPFAMNAAEARRMVEVAHETGRRVIEAYHDRYHPLSDEIGRIRTSGRIGAIVSVTAGFSIDMPFERGGIRHEPSLGGGAMMDLGCYPLHWLRVYTGEVPIVGENTAVLSELGADANIESRLAFPSGIVADLSCTFNGGAPTSLLTIKGTGGSARIENLVFPSYGHSIQITVDGLVSTSTVAGRSTFDHQLEAVVAGLTSGDPLPTEGDDPIRTMEAIDAIYTAAGIDRTGFASRVG